MCCFLLFHDQPTLQSQLFFSFQKSFIGKGKRSCDNLSDIIIFKKMFITLKVTFLFTSCPNSFPQWAKWYGKKYLCSFKSFCQRCPPQNSTEKEEWLQISFFFYLFSFNCTFITLENMMDITVVARVKACPKGSISVRALFLVLVSATIMYSLHH